MALGYTFGSPMYDPKDKVRNTEIKTAYMLNELCRAIEYDGLPDTIPAPLMNLIGLVTGGVMRPHSGPGRDYVFELSLGGEPDPYYLPSKGLIANPALDLCEEYKIGEEITVIKYNSTMTSFLPLLSQSARELSENELTLYNISILARAMYAIIAQSEEDAEAAEEFIDSLEAGDLKALVSSTFWTSLNIVPTATNMADLMKSATEREQYLYAQSYIKRGMQANWNSKREATNEAEAGMGVDTLMPLIWDMFKSICEGWDNWNKHNPDETVTPRLAGVWARRFRLAEAEVDMVEREAEGDVSSTETDNKGDISEPVDTGDGDSGEPGGGTVAGDDEPGA